ncbi:MAG: polysaccharide biosynthesis C-terminal domain-containing protein, partial [Lachnospiraceae bacterium]|nr:polysaccharide biosynthesis C-terminal domain-containing protein [Lachnospiraceae bacterium]
RVKWEYMLAHMKFGTKILPANMVVELNTKVDIICLGFLVKNDFVIGIYSFAILFAEGFYQIYIVIRRSINPKLTEASVSRKLEGEFTAIDQVLRKCFRWLSPFLMIAIMGAYYVVCLVLGRTEYFEGMKYLFVICAAMVINGRSIVYGNIFSQLGFPVIESGINVITVFSNFAMNICFILLCGTMGAAAATAISHCIYGGLIRTGIKRKFGLSY